MQFGSDNTAGASAKIMAVIAAANDGRMASYGADEVTARVERAMAEFFDREVAVFLVTTGTAANALAIQALCPVYGAVLAHEESHLLVDECGAPEFFSGAKLVGVPGVAGKVTPSALETALRDFQAGFVHHVQPRMLSLTQATEAGTVYRPDELTVLCGLAKSHGLTVHMDGARFANALAALGSTPADVTWRAGVDVLSFGATKNGAVMAEAVVFFDPERGREFGYLRKRAGQLISKHRFIAAQFDAWLDGDHWRELASHANAMAARLAEGIAAGSRARLGFAVEANEVFAIVDAATDARLRAAGAVYHPWPAKSLGPDNSLRSGETLIRLVASFATTADEVDRFIALVE